MKILGQGGSELAPGGGDQVCFVAWVLDTFTISAESKAEQEDLIRRVAAA
jgi:hypothetical protein